MKVNRCLTVFVTLLAWSLPLLFRSEAAAVQRAFDPMQQMTPAGSYRVQVLQGASWEEAGSLTFDRFLREKRLDLSRFLKGGLSA